MLPSPVFINILNYVIVEQLNQGSPEYDNLTAKVIREVYFLSTSGQKNQFSN
jgi:hypothetical protein